MKVTTANRSKVITKSTFNGYDACINPYVGCQVTFYTGNWIFAPMRPAML